MSRLDSFIRRLEAQRRCLAYAVEAVAELPGPVLELGLGNGRTYDHLRELCPEREIFVFERKVAAHPDCIPDAPHLFEGPLDITLPRSLPAFAGQVALIHADLGSGDPKADARTSAVVAKYLPELLQSGALILSDQPLTSSATETLPPPEGVDGDRYYIYRAR